jgi:hypothetical protein
VKKKIIPVLAGLSLSFGIFASPSLASEVDTVKPEVKTLDEKQVIQEIKKHYKDLDVQKKLIEKTKKGELHDSVNPKKRSLGVEKKLDENTIQTTYPDGSQTLEGVDFSEAVFYDETGNEISNPYQPGYQPISPESEDNKENKEKKQKKISFTNVFNSFASFVETPKAQAAVLSIKVYRTAYARWEASFNADFCNHTGAYDKLSRVYNVDIEAGDSWSILSQGVFRTYETYSYNAYGGVKFQVKSSPDSSMTTENLYLRVGNDTYWYQSSY